MNLTNQNEKGLLKKLDWAIGQEDAGLLNEFRDVYKKLCPNEWISLLEEE